MRAQRLRPWAARLRRTAGSTCRTWREAPREGLDNDVGRRRWSTLDARPPQEALNSNRYHTASQARCRPRAPPPSPHVYYLCSGAALMAKPGNMTDGSSRLVVKGRDDPAFDSPLHDPISTSNYATLTCVRPNQPTDPFRSAAGGPNWSDFGGSRFGFGRCLPNLAELGPYLAPNLGWSRTCSGHFGLVCKKFGQRFTYNASACESVHRRSGIFNTIWDQNPPRSAARVNIGPKLAETGPDLVELCHLLAGQGRAWTKLNNFARNHYTRTRLRPKFVRRLVPGGRDRLRTL